MEEMTLIPKYMERRMAKIRVPKIPPTPNLLKVVAAVLKQITERMEIKHSKKRKKHWQDQPVNLWILVWPEALSEIPETFLIGEEKLNTFAEGRKSKCFVCGELSHIKLECQRKETEEQQEEVG